MTAKRDNTQMQAERRREAALLRSEVQSRPAPTGRSAVKSRKKKATGQVSDVDDDLPCTAKREGSFIIFWYIID